MPLAELGDIDLHYRSYGDGPAVLGVMGFGLDQRYWAGQVPAVSVGNRFITFDNRGTGRSSLKLPESIEQMADDAVRLLDHLEIEKAVIFGASMGGTIAQRIALDHPERLGGLILAITWARPIEFMRRQHELARLVISELGPERFAEATLLWMFTPRFFEMGRELIDQMMGALTAPGAPEMMSPEALLAQLDAFSNHDVLAELPKISAPTLVVGGHMDVMVPGLASEEIAAAIPGARLEMFDSGHGLMIEEMQRFNDLIRSFLDSLK
ncbi:MAG: alpha/beta fold hydrolase [Actinomycetota bacterium]